MPWSLAKFSGVPSGLRIAGCALRLLTCGVLLETTQALLHIPRYAFGSLSYKDFYQRGPQRDAPLILTGVPPSSSACFGERQAVPSRLLDSLAEGCGGGIRLDEMVRDSTQRGRKRPFASVGFREFLRMWRAGPGGLAEVAGAARGPLHAMEFPILERCSPALSDDVRIPPYFSGDAGLRARATGAVYGENPHYPALSFSESGFMTAGHVDMPSTDIWIAMCFGRKRVRVVSASTIAAHWDHGARFSRFASGKLSASRRLALNLHFHRSLDLFDEAFVARELRGARVLEGSIAAGDILYLPASALHAVSTLERSLYVIYNYVDLNALLAPNRNQLALQLDACGQRCHLRNFTAEYGGTPTICRREPGCSELVARLLDERSRLPLLDSEGPVGNGSRRPRGAARLPDVAAAGSELYRRRPRPWRPEWQGR